TMWYARVLKASLHRVFLHDGAERSIELDILSVPLLDTRSTHPFWPLRKIEQRALEQMDIPIFVARSDSDSLAIGTDGIVSGCFTASPFGQAVSRLNQLSEGDLERQVAFIRASLYGRAAAKRGGSIAAGLPERDLDATTSFDVEDCLRTAVTIAEELQA